MPLVRHESSFSQGNLLGALSSCALYRVLLQMATTIVTKLPQLHSIPKQIISFPSYRTRITLVRGMRRELNFDKDVR